MFVCFFFENISIILEPIINVRGRYYRILDTIGQGAEATVYRCEDQNAVQYAVKVFYYSRYPPSDLSRRVGNFKNEARMLKYLSQRSRYFIFLVDYEYKPRENIGYMIMELGNGSLRKHLVGAPLPDAQRRYYWQQIATILKDLQDAHVGKKYRKEYFFLYFIFKVHADIKPDNLVIVNNVIKLTDLGLAFRMDSPRSTARRPGVRGTLGMHSIIFIYYKFRLLFRLYGTGSFCSSNRFQIGCLVSRYNSL